MAIRVSIDLTKCEASGRCYNYAADVFEVGPKRQAKVIVSEISDDDWEVQASAESAAVMCPADAIVVESDDD